jgi:SAM-dependent methyltransferase
MNLMEMIPLQLDSGLGNALDSLETEAGHAQYVCPDCLASLSSSGTEFWCTSCRASFPIIDGIPVFAANTRSDCGTIATLDLERLRDLCEAQGWRKGVASFLAHADTESADFLARYFIPEARAAGRLLLPPGRRTTLLDLGCGIGPLSINFSHYVDDVVAADCGLVQLQLLKARAKEAGLNNLRLVCAGDRRHLPFPSGTFDLVLLNGVLEWVGIKFKGEPRQRQIEFLKEVRRVLKPDGEVYIGIENRFGLPYLFGMPDEHTRLRFVTLLPRLLADTLSRTKVHKPYRIYTYSRRGFRKLLREAGYGSDQFYFPLPNYRNVRQIAHHHSKPIVEPPPQPISRIVKRYVKSLSYPYLSHSFSIVAAGATLRANLVEDFIARLENWLGTRTDSPKLYRSNIQVGDTSVALVAAGTRDERVNARFMLRIPLTPEAERLQQHSFKMLQRLDADSVSPELNALLPTPVVLLQSDRQLMFVHRLCPGFDLRQFCSSRQQSSIFRMGLEFLLALAKVNGEHEVHSAAKLQSWLQKRRNHLCESFPRVAPTRIAKLVEQTWTSLESNALPLVWSHGDFWPGNLLSLGSCTRLTGVVDWEFVDSEGLPLMDLLQLLLYTKAMHTGKGYGSLLAERMSAGSFTSDEIPLIREYCDKLHIPNRAVWALAFMSWLDWVYRRTAVHGHLRSWQVNEIDRFIGAVEALPDSAA